MMDKPLASGAEGAPDRAPVRSVSSNDGILLSLQQSGYLPRGVHDLTLAEIREHFGTFRSSDRRPRLFEKLVQFLEQARVAGFVRFVVVNGSFISAKPDPGDIDLIVVIDPSALEGASWTPTQYNVLSSRRIRHSYPFDAFVVPEGSPAYDTYLDLFSRIKEDSTSSKGVVRVRL
jgi:hypothetical protein